MGVWKGKHLVQEQTENKIKIKVSCLIPKNQEIDTNSAFIP